MQGGSSGAFNLGTGRGYSVKQVLDAIRAEANDRLEVGRGPRRPGDPPILVADAALAGAELGFKPRQSDLKTIIATAWAWHRRAHLAQRAARPRRRDGWRRESAPPVELSLSYYAT